MSKIKKPKSVTSSWNTQIHERFLKYLRETFHLSEKEITAYQEVARTHLKKSIRFNTSRVTIKQEKKRLEKEGWKFTKTPVPEVFYVDREDTSIALGNTIEHLMWEIYVQEVAASHSVDLLRKKMKKEPYLILDMCASPGGKATQLAEYYPWATIIANESSRDRLSQLYTNLDRMAHPNIVVTNMDGRRFSDIVEKFDGIVIDAPCSGEWTAYKHGDILKYWHIKNIKRIAKLQSHLLLSGIHALVTGWSMVYSTCTINKLENEWVIEKVTKKLWKGMKLIYSHRFWPQKEGMWGFFISYIQKKEDIPEQEGDLYIRSSRIELLGGKKKEIVENWYREQFSADMEKGYYYTYEKDVYFCAHNIGSLLESLHLTKAWITIGHIVNEKFEPTHNAWVIFCSESDESWGNLKATKKLDISDDSRIHEYLTTGKTSYTASSDDASMEKIPGHYELYAHSRSLGIAHYDWSQIHTYMSRKLWRRV